mmetsp:Transcript_11387/g.34231  ORF Transcript_11387/g.34231 Transcript_11387/m.34231 type:complete len:576 (+) Transcript_11387:105-1832(+)
MAAHALQSRLGCQVPRMCSAMQLPRLHAAHPRLSSSVQTVRQLRCCPVAMAQKAASNDGDVVTGKVRVRFAPSPTGALHVGGARTALYNWLFARRHGGKMILRIEDTDLARSTKQSEVNLLEELKWLGIDWDEGPDVGGDKGPYRQSERNALYKEYADKLVKDGVAYPCFCTDEELDEMKRIAASKNQAPIYRGKWGRATAEEVQEAKDAGIPYCYRFRSPKDQEVTINDAVRGEVTWNTNTLGDFVILRSNGQPVYNFCVAVDDATMEISHVLRAEEHLPNTLRQVLLYKALGFKPPTFGHMSLILAPDKSKLSKRHGATSVGEFRDEGYLPDAMTNFLALLGWNEGDGSQREMYSLDELVQAFSLGRITKSGAVFDKTKLSWMNGQYLRSRPDEELIPQLAGHWAQCGLLKSADQTPFVVAAVAAAKNSLELLPDADKELKEYLAYPLEATMASPEVADVVSDDFPQVANAALQAYESGKLQEALESGADGFKKWLKAVGKEQGRKGKRLFMPMRIALTGNFHGPDLPALVSMLMSENGEVNAEAAGYVPLAQRMEQLKAKVATMPQPAEAAA